MPPAPNPASPNFDKLAKPYRWLEYLTFGPILKQTRTHYLPALADRKQALVLGDGDGRFTAALLRSNPQIQIHAVDLSPAMLQALQSAAHPHTNRLTTEAADLRHWQPEVPTDRSSSVGRQPGVPDDRSSSTGLKYDLIATHFFLDCLTTDEIASMVNRLTPSTTPDAQWLISDFAVPPTHFGRFIARPLIAFLYQTFHLLTGLNRHPENGPAKTQLPNHKQALEQAGWRLQAHHPRLKGLLFSQIWSASPGQAAQTKQPCPSKRTFKSGQNQYSPKRTNQANSLTS